jgi:hypothetical protein
LWSALSSNTMKPPPIKWWETFWKSRIDYS